MCSEQTGVRTITQIKSFKIINKIEKKMVQLIGKRREITQNWQWPWDGPRGTRLVTTWRGRTSEQGLLRWRKGSALLAHDTIAQLKSPCGSIEKPLQTVKITPWSDWGKNKKKSKQSWQSASVAQPPSWGLDPIHNGVKKNKGNNVYEPTNSTLNCFSDIQKDLWISAMADPI